MRHWKQWSTILVMCLAATATAQPTASDDKPATLPPPPTTAQPQPPTEPGTLPQAKPKANPFGAQTPRNIKPLPAVPDPRIEQWQRARVYVLPPGKKEKAAFLGVSGSPVPPVLREQLKLEKGVGLVVDFVEPKSPADEAGIKQYDVLEKLGDQLLINAHQFATLVRMHKAGDEIELTLIRHGESKQVKAKLTEKEVMALDDTNPWGIPPGPWQNTAGADIMSYKPVKVGVVGGGAGGGFGGGFGAAGAGTPYFYATVRRDAEGSAEIRWKDDAGEVTITTSKDGHRRVEAKDKSGKVTFTGPIDTPEQIKAAPADVREKIQKMDSAQPKLEIFPYPLQDVKGVIRFNDDRGEVQIVAPEPPKPEPAPDVVQ